jgi:uncharacterized protein (TIGR02145 family)
MPANYYISSSGNDSNNGSSGSPWATLYHACNQVITPGDTIIELPGTITEADQCSLAVGVNLEGYGPTYSILKSHVSGDFAILLESGSPNENGNQHIAGLKLDGDSLTGYAAIDIYNRGNVEIYGCEIIDFSIYGIEFNGYRAAGTAPPSTYNVGNKFHDNIVNNCSAYSPHGNKYGGEGKGALMLDNQQTLEIYNNTMTQTSRAAGYNGWLIKSLSNGGFLKDVKIYNNTITKANYDGLTWDFAMEFWNLMGGIEIYGNTITGSIDFSGWYGVQKGAYDYSVWVHNNTIGISSGNLTGIYFEIYEENAIIERNTFSNVGCGIAFNFYTSDLGPPNKALNTTIRYNIFKIVGTEVYPGGYPEGQGIAFSTSLTTNVIDNFNVYNNVFYGVAGTASTSDGIELPDVGIATNIRIFNNIIEGFDNSIIARSNGPCTIDYLWIENNTCYDNGNNSPYLSLTPTHYTNSGNLTSDPLFVSSSDFHLQVGSPSIGTGVFVASGLIDLDGNAVYNPPSRGAYESGSAPPSPVLVTSISVIGTGSATTITTDNGTLQMLASILPIDATDPSVTWSLTVGTGNGSISSDGLLTALTDGTVTIRATANDLSGIFDELVITISNQTLPAPPAAPPSNALYNWWAINKVKIIYGYLYNWYAATDVRNIAPTGWHLPSQAEWIALGTYLTTNGYGYGGSGDHIAKSMAAASGWTSDGTPGHPGNDQASNNSSGFNAFPIGLRESGSGLGAFSSIGTLAYFWCSNPSGSDYVDTEGLDYSWPKFSNSSYFKEGGEAIRLIKDDSINPGIVTGNDGQTYNTIKIGSQVWTSQNLIETKYRNGDSIPIVTDNTAWVALTTGARCSYNNDENNAFTGVSFAPVGCHVPTQSEFTTLQTYLGGQTVAGGHLKETGLAHWQTPNTGADNSSGFAAFGSGYRYGNEGSPGVFLGLILNSYYWEFDIYTSDYSYYSRLLYNQATFDASGYAVLKSTGLSVRCLLDDPSSWHEGDTIVDIDGYIYATVKIGTQVWMASNLYVKHFNDGTPIPMGGADPRFYTDAEWAALTTEGMCLYGVDSVETLPPDGGGNGGGGGVPGGGGTGTVVFSNDSDEINFDEPLNVTFSIGDIREVSFGSNNKSYTLNFPLTKKIKKLLKFINQADVKSEPNARAYLYVRKTLVIAGKVIVLGYSDTAAKVIISADDWMDVLSNTKMSALNLSDSTFVLSIAKVQDSWSASYPAYRYPMINFGCLMSGESGATANWLATDFIPMISIAYLINKILTPYTIVSDWLNSTFVKDLFILANELVNDDSFSSGKGLNVSTSEGSDNIETGSSSSNLMVTLDKDIEFFTVTLDEASAWADDTYLIPAAGTYHFKASVTFSNTAFGNYSLNILDEQVILEIRKNGVAVKTLTSDPYTGTEIINGITYHYDSGYIHCALHDLITLHTTTRCYVHVNSGTETVSIAAASANLVNTSNKYAAIGDSIDLATELPDMTQLDFLAAIRDIFNLRFFMDKPKGTIYIEPWDQLLTSEVIDITEFVDFEDKPAETISQYYSKKINLLWKNDLDDVAFTEFLKLNAEVPGKKEIIMTSQFAIPGLDIREHQFSSVIMDYNQVLGEYTTKVPRIFNSIPVTPYTPYDRKIGFNTRIVHWAGYTAGFSWKFETGTLTSYPKIEPIDWTDIYTDYWQKLFHYVDKGKLYTIKMKIKAGYLTQFMTKVDNVEKEAFRPVYRIQFGNVKNDFFLTKITSDGWLAELELVLKT